MNFGVLLTILSGILYGTIGYFGIRLLEAGLSVSDMLFWRFFSSVILLFPFVLVDWFKKNQTRNYLTLLFLFILGILLYGLGTAMYFEACKMIGTGLAMVLFYTYPLFVVGLSYFVHQTPLTKPIVLSLILIVIGSSLIAFGDGIFVNLNRFGILLAIFSGIGYGLYLFFSKRIAHEVPPILATFTVCLGSSFTFMVSSLLTTSTLYWPTSPSILTLIGLFGLVGTVLPVLFMLIGLKTISANKASIISVIEPVTILAVAIIVLKESVTYVQMIGATIILCSAIIIQLDRQS